MARFYVDERTGQRWPSVTTICGQLPKPGLEQWHAKKAAEYALANPGATASEIAGAATRYVKEASERGTRVHAALVSGKWPKDLAGWKASARNLFREHKIETLHQEVVVYNREHRYAGTLDAIAKVDGVYSLLDFKTAISGVWPSTRIQLAGYRYSDDCRSLPFERFYVARITESEYELREVEVGLAEWEVFKRLRLNYEWCRDAQTRTGSGRT